MALDVVASVGKQLVAPVSQFGYFIFYNRNIKNLKKQVQKLEDTRDRIQRNGQIIEPSVEQWLTTVDEVSKQTERFLRDEDKWWCPNLKSRYPSSKEAKMKIEDVVELYEGLGDFSSAPMGIASTFISARGIKGFESRRLIMNEVMEALTDDSINMIGICGMGGVGKTTLVKEVAKKAEENKLFNEVVLAEVPQDPSFTVIQGMIAAQLGF
ncbi:unnamed protein product [Camellia sinensis]